MPHTRPLRSLALLTLPACVALLAPQATAQRPAQADAKARADASSDSKRSSSTHRVTHRVVVRNGKVIVDERTENGRPVPSGRPAGGRGGLPGAGGGLPPMPDVEDMMRRMRERLERDLKREFDHDMERVRAKQRQRRVGGGPRPTPPSDDVPETPDERIRDLRERLRRATDKPAPGADPLEAWRRPLPAAPAPKQAARPGATPTNEATPPKAATPKKAPPKKATGSPLRGKLEPRRRVR